MTVKKFLGIIAIVAMIGFVFAGCGDGGGGGGDWSSGGGGDTGGGGGDTGGGGGDTGGGGTGGGGSGSDTGGGGTGGGVTVPAAPTNVRATSNSASEIEITWNPVSGTGITYRVYSATSATGTFTAITGAGSVSGTSFTHRNLLSETTRWYRVSAANSAGRSAQSTGNASATTLSLQDGNRPNAPTQVRATATSSRTITVNWQASTAGNPTEYRIYRRTGASGSFNRVGTSTTTSFSDTGLQPSTRFDYRVVAVNLSGLESPQSTTTGSATTYALPSTPTGINANSTSSNSITITWSSVQRATSYRVYRSISSSGPFTVDGTATTTTSFTSTGWNPGQTGFFRVRAIDSGGGESTQSTGNVSATTQASGGGDTGGGGTPPSGSGSLRIVNNSSRAIPDLQMTSITWSSNNPLDGRVLLIQPPAQPLPAGSERTVSVPVGTYNRITSSRFAGNLRVEINRTFTVTAGQTMTVTITDVDIRQ